MPTLIVPSSPSHSLLKLITRHSTELSYPPLRSSRASIFWTLARSLLLRDHGYTTSGARVLGCTHRQVRANEQGKRGSIFGKDEKLERDGSSVLLCQPICWHHNSEAWNACTREGTSVWALGLLITIKALGSETGGSYSLSEEVVYPGQEVARHVHTLEDEMWYMLDGELIWNLGGRESLGRKGSFIHLPRFIPHSFMNRSDKPARMMLMYAPGGFEQWYLDIGKAVLDPSQLPPNVTADELTQAMQRGWEYGVMLVDHDLEENGELSSGPLKPHYR